VRQVGWIFLTFALAVTLLTGVFGWENVWLMAILLITLFLGIALLAISFAARIYRGDLKLRPWDAAKKASAIFVIIVALRLFTQLAFPSEGFDLTEVITFSVVFAIAYGISATVYRKPA
jgi:hypothetical protein